MEILNQLAACSSFVCLLNKSFEFRVSIPVDPESIIIFRFFIENKTGGTMDDSNLMEVQVETCLRWCFNENIHSRGVEYWCLDSKDEIQLEAVDLLAEQMLLINGCRVFERFNLLRDTNHEQYSIKTVTSDVHSDPLYIHPNFSLKRTINFNLLCFTFQTPTFRFRPKGTLLLSWQILGKHQHFATQKSERSWAGEGERFIGIPAFRLGKRHEVVLVKK